MKMFNLKYLYSGFLLIATGIGIILSARSAHNNLSTIVPPTQIVLIAPSREAAPSRERDAEEAFVQKLKLRRLYVMVKNGMVLTADELKIARGCLKIEQARREQVILKRELHDYEGIAYDKKWNELRLIEEHQYPSMEEEVLQDKVQRLMEYNIALNVRKKLDSLIFANSYDFIQLTRHIDRLGNHLSYVVLPYRNELNSLSIRALLTDPEQFIQNVETKMEHMPKDINLLNQLEQIQQVFNEYHGPSGGYQDKLVNLRNECYGEIHHNIIECRDPRYLLHLLKQRELCNKNEFGFDRNIREKLLSFNSEQLFLFPPKMIYKYILRDNVVREIDQILAASDGYLTSVDATRLLAKTRGNENETTALNNLIEVCKPPAQVPIETDFNTLNQKYARRWFERPNQYFDRLNLPREFRGVQLGTKRRFELYEVQSHIQNGAYSNIELRMLFQHREMLLEKHEKRLQRKKLIGRGLAAGGTTLLIRQITIYNI